MKCDKCKAKGPYWKYVEKDDPDKKIKIRCEKHLTAK